MPKARLVEPFRTIESDLIKGMLEGLKRWRPDLSYPESHSDMEACVRELLREYEIKRRPSRIDLPEEE